MGKIDIRDIRGDGFNKEVCILWLAVTIYFNNHWVKDKWIETRMEYIAFSYHIRHIFYCEYMMCKM